MVFVSCFTMVRTAMNCMPNVELCFILETMWILSNICLIFCPSYFTWFNSRIIGLYTRNRLCMIFSIMFLATMFLMSEKGLG